MTAAERHRLLGSYKTPSFRYGDTIRCEVRGELVLVGLSAPFHGQLDNVDRQSPWRCSATWPRR
jgi:hypothetical protein